MTTQEARQGVIKILEEILMVEADTIQDSDNLAKLGADSIDIFEIGMALEERFGFGEIPDGDFEKVQTAGDLVTLVVDKLNSQDPAALI